MDIWTLGELVRPLVVAFIKIAIVVAFIIEEMHITRTSTCAEPSLFRYLTKRKQMNHIQRSDRDYCVSFLRMDVRPFMYLSQVIRDTHLLVDTRHVSIEERFTIFLHVVGHSTKNMTMR